MIGVETDTMTLEEDRRRYSSQYVYIGLEFVAVLDVRRCTISTSHKYARGCVAALRKTRSPTHKTMVAARTTIVPGVAGLTIFYALRFK